MGSPYYHEAFRWFGVRSSENLNTFLYVSCKVHALSYWIRHSSSHQLPIITRLSDIYNQTPVRSPLQPKMLLCTRRFHSRFHSIQKVPVPISEFRFPIRRSTCVRTKFCGRTIPLARVSRWWRTYRADQSTSTHTPNMPEVFGIETTTALMQSFMPCHSWAICLLRFEARLLI